MPQIPLRYNAITYKITYDLYTKNILVHENKEMYISITNNISNSQGGNSIKEPLEAFENYVKDTKIAEPKYIIKSIELLFDGLVITDLTIVT